MTKEDLEKAGRDVAHVVRGFRDETSRTLPVADKGQLAFQMTAFIRSPALANIVSRHMTQEHPYPE